jgi:hypothetical protein
LRQVELGQWRLLKLLVNILKPASYCVAGASGRIGQIDPGVQRSVIELYPAVLIANCGLRLVLWYK